MEVKVKEKLKTSEYANYKVYNLMEKLIKIEKRIQKRRNGFNGSIISRKKTKYSV
jgi:hypothetical protein